MDHFTVSDDGVLDNETKQVVIAQPLEVVRYSERDDTVYLQWPSKDGDYYNMAAIPRRIIKASASITELITRCRDIGLEVSTGMENALRTYLSEATMRFVKQA